jgi:hypothetical protein
MNRGFGATRRSMCVEKRNAAGIRRISTAGGFLRLRDPSPLLPFAALLHRQYRRSCSNLRFRHHPHDADAFIAFVIATLDLRNPADLKKHANYGAISSKSSRKA